MLAADIAALKTAGFPAHKVMADVHSSWGGGLDEIVTSLGHANGFNVTGINCETNGENT